VFEGLENLVAGLEAMQKFRETPEYKKHYDSFGEALRAYHELEDELGGLEGLMLEAYRWSKFIRRENKILLSNATSARPVDTAIMDVMEIVDEPLESCVPLYYEVDALETLSFSAFVVLKKAGEVKFCKHCNRVLNGPCKKHKEPTSVDDLFPCKGCGGYLSKPCQVHRSPV